MALCFPQFFLILTIVALFGNGILVEAVLSFLGLGVRQGTISWGKMPRVLR